MRGRRSRGRRNEREAEREGGGTRGRRNERHVERGKGKKIGREVEIKGDRKSVV